MTSSVGTVRLPDSVLWRLIRETPSLSATARVDMPLRSRSSRMSVPSPNCLILFPLTIAFHPCSPDARARLSPLVVTLLRSLQAI